MEKRPSASSAAAAAPLVPLLAPDPGSLPATPNLKSQFAGSEKLLPREKIAALGPAALSDAELLALLLRTGRKGRNVLATAEDLLHAHGDSFARLAGAAWTELAREPGLGPARAGELSAVFEIARRILASSTEEAPLLDEAPKIARYLRPWTIGESVERFFVLPLDKKLRLCGTVRRTTGISTGTADAVFVHPRDVFRTAVRADACYVAVAHNHPSGDPSPSMRDLKLTRDLVDAGRVLGIPLLDHVIVGDIPRLRAPDGSFAADVTDATPRFHSVRQSGEVDFD